MVLDHFQKLHNGEQNEAKLKSLGTGTVGCVALDQNGKKLHCIIRRGMP
jgi:isoaspartyl peptidase/L-asparaginase-like protein (Ntn-hydrolase superfamily)